MVVWSKDHVREIGFHYAWSLEVSCGALFNWRPDGALRQKAEDRQLGRAWRVMWKAGTSKVVALVCVD
jgi:hypothetical protein